MCDKNKEFWETNHKTNNRYWLTDSEPDYVYKLHDLNTMLMILTQNILEVGVGTGRSIIRLAEIGHQVYAVDISDSALEKIKCFATAIQIHEGHVWPKNKIDIALCHLVFQHCDDNDFRYIIRKVLESLAPDGFFSFQSADAEEHKLGESCRQFMAEGHIFFRSKDTVIKVVEEACGKIVSISEDIVHPNEWDIVWNIFRVRRA